MAKSSSTIDPAGKASRTPQAVNIGGESLAERLMPHLKKIIAVMVIVGVIVSVIFVMRWRGRVAQEKKSALAAALFTDLDRNIVKPEPAAGSGSAGSGSAAGSDAPPVTETPAATAPTFASSAERATTGLADIAAKGLTGMVGPAYEGGLLLDAGRFDDAIAAYTKGAGTAGLDGEVAREGVGLALEAKALAATDATAKQGLLVQALAAFVAAQPDAAGPRRDYALYHQGRILMTMGKFAEATKAFEQALTIEDTELESTLKDRLAQLEAKN